MEVLKRSWAQIAALLSGLNRTERAAIILAALFLLSVLLYLVTWTGQAELARLTGIPRESVPTAVDELKRYGVDYTLKNDMIYVKQADYFDALATLKQSDLMVVDIDVAFEDYLLNQSPWSTNEQAKSSFNIALQKALGDSVEQMIGIESATVLIGRPANEGFGATLTKPTASVSVKLSGRNKKLGKEQVAAIANHVAGAIAKLEPQEVSITDLTNGRVYHVGRDDEVDPSEVYAQVRREEDDLRDKIYGVVSHIPGVRVEVSIKTDKIARKESNKYVYDKNGSIIKEESETMSRKNVSKSGAPGVYSNTSLDIAGSQGAGSEEESEKTKTESSVRPVTEVTHLEVSGPEVLQKSATVMVPRSFFAQVWKRNNPDSENDPTDADLEPIKSQRCAAIEQNVIPLLNDNNATVRVDWMDDSVALAAASQTAGMGTVVDTVAGLGLTKHVGSIALGVLAVGLMLWMVRSATKPEKLPTVEELAGIPPELPSEEEFVGEVDEQEATMAGYELDESELQSRRIAEQISELIKSNPEEAGNIFGRWVQTDD
ncbi:hypothetical protein JD969_17070 [Planctomycetota bacterium]|nr:hypothetical protein JD969_17070 [Planctomycetota bacterium]